MERENQRITITKRLLKESMLRLLKEKELDKISVTELCREAGINRATFYRHYEIPRDVLIEIEKDLYHDLREAVRVPAAQEDIYPCIEEMCLFLEQHKERLRVLLQCNSDTDFVLFVNEIFEELYQEVGNMPAFRELNQEDIRLMALYTAGGSYFLLRHWLTGGIPKSAEEMSAYIYGLLQKTDIALICSRLGFPLQG